MIELLELSINTGGSIDLKISLWLLVPTLLVLVGVWILKSRLEHRSVGRFEIDEAEIGIGDQRIKLKPNYQDLQVAFQLWTELSTRKIGLSIDEENDVIVEIYDSWYDFFKITRDLIKSIPVSRLRRNESTKELVRISLEILNDQIRPHLTKWQAQFRYWYEISLREKGGSRVTPQELQREYPDYDPLMMDLKDVNSKLVAYARVLGDLVYEV